MNGMITKHELSQLLIDYIDSKELKVVPGTMLTDGTVAEAKLDTSVKNKINKATYTKTETDTVIDNRIKVILGAAPEALDTLVELANALGNDPNFATTITTSLGNKVDKVSGKMLSTNDFTAAYKTKLDSVATSANNYVHPSTHPASVIVQDATNRFVTDAEKSAWNGKPGGSIATTTANGMMSKEDKVKLNGVATSANNYVHPSTHPASIVSQDASNRFVTDAEKSTWNGKASTAVATNSSNGLMSSSDKTKLDAVANTYQPKLGFNKKTNTLTADNATVAIGITGFDRAKHLLMVFKNSVYLEENVDFTVSSDNLNIVCKVSGYKYPSGTSFNFIVLKI